MGCKNLVACVILEYSLEDVILLADKENIRLSEKEARYVLKGVEACIPERRYIKQALIEFIRFYNAWRFVPAHS